MSPTATDREPGDELALLDAMAAEYVLGSLAGEPRLLFERLLGRDEAVRALVVGWEARLQGLADALPRHAPSDAFRSRVLQAVRDADESADAASEDGERRSRVPDDPMPGPLSLPAARQVDIDLAARRSRAASPALAPIPAPAPERPRVMVRTREIAANDSGWRAGAIAASVLAAALLAVLAGQMAGVPERSADVPDVALVDPAPSGEPVADVVAVAPTEGSATAAPPTALSLLRDDEGRPRYLVEIDEADSSVRITALDAPPVASDASLQLWMADGASGELRAIGLLPTDPWSSLRLERVPLVEREPAFAVSEEPSGGSPEAGPTGSVVFQGTVHPLGDGN